MQTSEIMATPELLTAINSLSRKVDSLLETRNQLLKRIKELEETNEILRNQHKEDLKTLEQSKKEVEFLSLSHRLANSPEALLAARQKVDRLIRTIDNCIRLIKED